MPTDVANSIDLTCEDLGQWLATLPAWEKDLGPPDKNGKSFRGPTLLGEADCRMHIVRMLTRHFDEPEWLHQEVPTSAYLFPGLDDQRSNWREQRYSPDIGVVDPGRLGPALTRDEMRGVRWNALIEVKFRGLNAENIYDDIKTDLDKLGILRAYCDHAYVIVVDEVEVPPFDAEREEALRAAAAEVDVDLRFVRATH